MADVSVIFVIGYDNKQSYFSLKSLVNQDLSSFEIILINNSGVRLKKIKYSNLIKKKNPKCKIKIKYFELKKKMEVFKARNYGLRKANGNFVAILDSDDFYKNTHLKTAISFLKKKKAKFYYSSYINFNSLTNNFNIRKCKKKLNKFDLLTFCPIGHSTVVFRKDLIKKYFPIKYRHDLATWSKLLKLDKKLIIFNQDINVIRVIGSKNFSKNKIKLLKYYYKTYKYAYNLNFYKIIFYFSFLFIRHGLNYLKIFFSVKKKIFSYKGKNKYFGLKNFITAHKIIKL
jgi:teichuronic acid biosynthesis glycosyltransferase TuaG